jgi:beta-catenin-like protein 1
VILLAGEGFLVPTQRPSKRRRTHEKEEEDEEEEVERVEELDNDAYFSSLVADPEIARLLEEADEKEVPEISLSSLKKLVYQLEKRITENEEMRIQFPNKPDKFMESEIQLNIAIANMHQVRVT